MLYKHHSTQFAKQCIPMCIWKRGHYVHPNQLPSQTPTHANTLTGCQTNLVVRWAYKGERRAEQAPVGPHLTLTKDCSTQNDKGRSRRAHLSHEQLARGYSWLSWLTRRCPAGVGEVHHQRLALAATLKDHRAV